ncbi:MAG: fructose-1,6-bisphosphatase, partial [Fusobacteriota bacterium]
MNKNREEELKYLRVLSSNYPNINKASTEIINLKAILKLPKGTEHFITDIHGEYEAFSHVLKNGSGVVKRKINCIFGDSLTEGEKKSLAILIYYPEKKLELITKEKQNRDEWYKITLYRLVKLCRNVSQGYSRSKVRKALPDDYSYILEELLNEQKRRLGENEGRYFSSIINTIIEIGQAKQFVVSLSKLIQRFVIDKLHIIGDIYDRGPAAEKIMDRLIEYHNVDIQWGNHDIVWMGAASGCKACIANVIRVSTRYANLHTLEKGYGINLLPLVLFSMDVYSNDPCNLFYPKQVKDKSFSDKELELIAKMQKAITIIQFKLEGQLIKKYPDFEMDKRLLLDKIQEDKVIIKGKEYNLKDTNLPTIDKSNPYKLTEEEKEVIDKLKISFLDNERLQSHVRFLFSKGSMYLINNSNLMYHGCIPLEEDGKLSKVSIQGKEYEGKDLLNKFEKYARDGYFKDDGEEKEFGKAIMWYLWCGQDSPIFGKKKMATFENYFLEDQKLKKEERNSYYKYRDLEKTANYILEKFELNPNESHIINGHVPVEVKKGESPIKAEGKLIVIDGGFSKAYQPKTGIAGYTLISNSSDLILVSHEPFESARDAIKNEKDIHG